MTNETTDEELSSILKRWHTFRRRRIWVFALPLFLAGLYGICISNPSPYFWIGFVILWAVHFLVDKHTKQEFAKQMTRQEFEILQQARETVKSYYNRGTIIELTQVYQDRSPKEELLRPFQQTQDDTLLRAAQYTADTPQEQLLRPASTDETRHA